jgi:hypothetical protein
MKFTKNQISEDTENQMRRRPQKFGAAMPDDDAGDQGLMPGGKAPVAKAPATNPLAAMAKPGEEAAGDTPGENGQPHTLESACAEIASLKERLDALDGGGAKEGDEQHSEPDQDDDQGFGEGKY